jgi:hypothetical protein
VDAVHRRRQGGRRRRRPDQLGDPVGRENAQLDTRTVDDVLAPIATFVAYGTEVGWPCDNLYCCG